VLDSSRIENRPQNTPKNAKYGSLANVGGA
jgi:hypothetical protein